MTHPLILAFDTSGRHCAVALMQGTTVLAARFEEMAKGQAEHLMPLIEATMAEDGLPLDVLDAIAVGVGPGNFTGIRIAVSAARGLALSLGIPAIGVTNFEVMRGPNSRHDKTRQLVSLPAPNGTVFLQAFRDGREDGAPHMMRSLQDPFWDRFEDSSSMPILGQWADDLSLYHPPSYTVSDPPPLEQELPTRLSAQIIGAIAVDKLADGADHPRPAPLYIKPADAAPSREAGPTIL